MKVLFIILTALYLSAVFAGGNQLFRIEDKIYHGYLDGDPLTVRSMKKILTETTGITDFAKKTDDTPQIRIYPVNFRNPSPEEKKHMEEISYPYGYAFDFDGRTFRILSKNQKGLNYGSVHFLRKFCTYRKFGGHPPLALAKPPYELPKSHHNLHQPSIPSLTVAWGGEDAFDRNIRTLIFSTHSLFRVLPPEKFSDSHPDYFPMINGKRHIPPKDPKKGHYYYGLWQPCLMNPELVKLTMEYAQNYFRKNPDNFSLPLGVNDGGGSCHCPGCEKLREKYGNQYIPYYNAVAREVAKLYPGKMVSFIAYGEAAAIPKNIKLEPNLLAEVAGGIGGDCSRLEQWRKAGAAKLGVYEYYNTIGSGYVIPQYYPRRAAELWRKAFRDYDIQSIWMELYPTTWIFASPRQYVLNALAWDINTPVETLLDEYFTLVYGTAAPEIKAAFDLFEKRNIRSFNNLKQIRNYTLADVAQIDRLLKSAASKNGNGIRESENLRLLQSFHHSFLRPHFIAAGALNALDSAEKSEDMHRFAEMALEACAELEKSQMPQTDINKIFINRLGKSNPKGFALLKNQSEVQLTPYVEQCLDRKFETLSCNWKELRERTKNPRLRAIYGTLLCRNHPHSKVNLSANPSFEILAPAKEAQKKNIPSDQLPFQAKGWRFWKFPNSKTVLFLDKKEKFSGTCSGAIGVNQISGCLIADFGINSAYRYRVTFKVKLSARERVTGEAQVRFLGPKGFIDNGSPVKVSYPESANGKWAECSMSFSPMPGATSAMLQLAAPVQEEGKNIWFDDVEIIEIFNPECFGEQTMLEANAKKGVYIEALSAAGKYPQTEHAIKFASEVFRRYFGSAYQNRDTIGIRIAFQPTSTGKTGAFQVKAGKDGILISGDDEGMRCGLFDVMERMGLRWLAPGTLLRITKRPIRIDFPSFTYEKTPRFPYRGMHICGGAMHHDKEVAQWMSFHKMNRRLCSFKEVGKMGGELERLGLKADTTVHTYHELIPDRIYFAEHPEFFALVGGKRIRQSAGGQLCLSNRELRKEFVKNILAAASKYPQITEVGICPNDGYGHCECEGCRALDTPEDKEKGLVNARIADFVGEICREVKKSAPNLRLGHFSYSNFANFTTYMNTAPDNLKLSFTQLRCLRHAVNDPACKINASNWKRLEKVHGKIQHVSLYEYYTYCWDTLPAPFAPVFLKDLDAYECLKLDGLLSEIPVKKHPAWRNYHYPVLAVMKGLYEKTSPDLLLMDCCNTKFPGAGEAMFQYFKAWENHLEKISGCLRISENTADDSVRLLTPEFLAEADRLLSAAEKKIWKPYRNVMKPVREDLDFWKRLVTDRQKYKLPEKLPLLTRQEFDSGSLPASKALPLLDKITLLPPEGAPADLWVYDGPDTLGIIVRCKEPHAAQVKGKTAKLPQTVDAVYYNDNVEFFFAPSPDSVQLWHLIVSAGGKSVASECVGKRWNWAWKHQSKSQTRFFENGWEVKLECLKSDFQISAGAPWFFTIVRNRYQPHWVTSGIPKGGAFFTPGSYLKVCP